MPIGKKFYAEIGGMQVYEYILTNAAGMSVSILNRGAIVKNLFVKDKNGKMTDVVLGHGDASEYEKNPGYLGAVVGRYANRLEDGEMIICGKKYKAGINEGRNSLHGGIVGFDKKMWDAEPCGSDTEPSLKMKLFSPDGEEGFPGNLSVAVTYTLTAKNALSIRYEAQCDKDTVVNLTNHSYFNLGGYDSGAVDDNILTLPCSFYTPNNNECMPTGEILSVDGTAFDFRKPKKLHEAFESEDEQIKMFCGIDHNFIIDGEGMRLCAAMENPDNGITMKVYTDMPAMQIYTCNDDELKGGKNGSKYGLHNAVCFETQYYPNSMKYSHFPSPVLKAGDKYDFTTYFEFNMQ